MENRITISICEEEYTFVAEEAPSYMQKVGSYVNDKMSELLDTSVQKDIDEMTAAGAVFSDIDTTPFREKLIDFYRGLEKDGTLPEGLVDKALNA